MTLQACLELGGLVEAVPMADLADRSRRILRENPRLIGDAGDHLDDPEDDWREYWRTVLA